MFRNQQPAILQKQSFAKINVMRFANNDICLFFKTDEKKTYEM